MLYLLKIVEIILTKEKDEFILVNKIDDSKLNDLFIDLSEIEFEYGGEPQFSSGLALKLNYSYGYEVISNTYV